MDAWILFLMLVGAALAAGTLVSIAWTTWRHRQGRRARKRTSLSISTHLGSTEPLHGILLENDGFEDVCVDRLQYRVDGNAVCGPSSRVGVLTLEAADLPSRKIRICAVEPGTVLNPGERVWLVSVDQAVLGPAERREFEAGLTRVGVEAVYFAAKASWNSIDTAQQARLIPPAELGAFGDRGHEAVATTGRSARPDQQPAVRLAPQV